jgi:hypothetical protein
VSIDVGVEDPDALTEGAERCRKVDRQRRFADAALAARDSDDPRGAVERDAFGALRDSAAELGRERRLLLGRHDVEIERDMFDPGTGASASATCCSKLERSGQPATVKAIVTATSPPSIRTSRTMSSSVTGRRSSGSMTCSSAFRISSWEGSTRTSLATRR